MYLPPYFRIEDPAVCFELMRQHPFALLVSTGQAGLQTSQLPLLLRQGENQLLGHMAKANEHWQELETASEVCAVFRGPHCYVSPTYYPEPSQNVPTWNYLTINVYGKVRLLDASETLTLLAEMAAVYEGPDGWKMEQLPESRLNGLSKAIVGFAMEITRVEGKAKLSQNRKASERSSLIQHLSEGDANAAAVATWMGLENGLSRSR